MRPTPRTDATERDLSDSPLNIETATEHLLDFARTLERENAELREALVAQERAEQLEAEFNQHHMRVFFKEAFDRSTEDAQETNRLGGLAKATRERALTLRKAALSKAAGTEQSEES